MQKERKKIEWGRGSAFNLGRLDDVRVERSRNNEGWSFLVSDSKLTYLYVDNRYYRTKEELDESIIQWVHEREQKKSHL